MYTKSLFTFLCLLFLSHISFAQNEPFQLRQVACDLEQPWEITYGPDDQLWVTESRAYKLLRIDPNTGNQSVVLDASNLKNFPNNQNPWPQGGFTGVALHPQLLNGKPYVYVAYTYQFDGCQPNDQGCFFRTKIERYTYNNGTLSNPQTVLDNIPGSNDHNGGRLIITEMAGIPYVLYTVGDMGAGQFGNAERPNNSQDPNIYEGKILRLNTEQVGGSWIPSSNPFGNAVWTLGHRNPQGLAVGQFGDLYSAEHGPWTDDEVNIIQFGRNYGHPLVSGFAEGNYNGVAVGTGSLLPIIVSEQGNANGITNYQDPIASYYAAPNNEVTDWYNYAVSGTQPFPNSWLFRPSIAPSGMGYYGETAIPNWNNSLLITSLKKATIYRQSLSGNGEAIAGAAIPYFEGLGRFRDVAISPNGDKIYVVCDKYGATSGPTQGTSIAPNNPGCVLEFEYAPGLTGCQNSYDGFTFIGDYNNAKYFISNTTSNWANGSALAEFYSGYLASPNDAAENEFLRTYLAANNEIAFIGVTDGNTEGTFELASGETTTYNNFTGTNSDNNDYGIMNFWDGSWGVNNITTQRRYIIEIPCSACTDNDNDGVCANVDCNDNNPNIPTTPDTSCDDGEPTTTNDVIQADGCTCLGEVPTPLLTIDCPADITVQIPAGASTITANWPNASGFTNCTGGLLGPVQIAGPQPGTQVSTGTYTITYNVYNQCAQSLDCSFTATVEQSSGGCNVATSVSNGIVVVTGLTSAENAKLFDANTTSVWECNPWNGSPCSNNETISGLSSGNYFLSVQSNVCSEWIPIAVSGGCIDNDSDGVCANDDCNDNDPTFPMTPGTPCNDFDTFTENDVIQSNGCICQGTPITTVLTLDCPANINAVIPAGSNSVQVNWVDAVPNTTCPSGITVVNQITGPAPGAQFSAGTYTVTFEAMNGCGDVETCDFNITVTSQQGGCDVNAIVSNGSITITGLTSAENAKLFDASISSVWECNPWNGTPCTGNEVINNLPVGQYFLSVQSDVCSEWIPITVSGGATCELSTTISNISCTDYSITYDIIVTGTNTTSNEFGTIVQVIQLQGGPVQQIPATYNLNETHTITEDIPSTGAPLSSWTVTVYDPGNNNCNDITSIDCPNSGCNINATATNGTITITGLTASVNAKLFDANISTIWECNPWNGSLCSFNEVINNLPNGDYFLSAQSTDCDEWIPITLTGVGATDSDGDGVPDAQDCEPNDPIIPATVGTTCNDFDNNTIDDKIQSDMCTCVGTPIGGGCNVSFTETNVGEITITGLTPSENTKIFDSSASSNGIVWQCNPWSSTCSGTEVISGLIPNAQYYLAVQSDNCEEWIPFMVAIVPLEDEIPTAFSDEAVLETFSIQNLFPNPTTSEAFVSLESNFDGDFTIEVYNTLGGLQSRFTSNIETGNNTIPLNVETLNAGIYHLVIKDQKGNTESIRFVKQ